MKKLGIAMFLAGTLWAHVAEAQNCTITISTPVTAVCEGTQVVIAAAYSVLPSDHFFDFNQNQLPPGWSTTGTAYFQNTLCVPHPSGTPYYWAQTTPSGALPQIITSDLDICSGGVLEFDMRYAIQGQASPCEGPDENNEGVSIEYSLDGGVTWVEFTYYRPDGVVLTANPMTGGSVATGNTPMTTWTTYTVPIPAAAISTSTRFRWIQKVSSTPAGSFDNWGLEDISVLAGPCTTYDVHWSNGTQGADTITFIATTDTTVSADLYDVNNVFMCASNSVFIQVFPTFATSFNATICDGDAYYFGPTSSALLPYTSNGSYPVTFLSEHGCDSVVTLNLNVLPIPTSTVTESICQGDSVVIGGQAFTATGNYPVTFTSVLTGCDSIVTLDLTVIPLPPTPNLTSNSPLCGGDSLVFGHDVGPGATYFWQGPSAFSSSDSAVVIYPVDVSHTGSYGLYVEQNGCYSDTQWVSVTVNAIPPTPDFISNSPICEGENLTFNGNASPTAGYVWSGPGGWGSTLPSPVIQGPLNAASGSYSLYVVENGCTSGTDTKPIEINHKPTVAYTGPFSVCGSTVPLSASAQVGAPSQIDSYTWWEGGSSIGQGQTQAHTFTVVPSVTVTGYVVAETESGCSDTAAYSVLLNVSPVADFSQSPPCSGLMVDFVANPQWDGTPAPGDVFQYDWDFGDGSTASTDQVSHGYTAADTYTVTLVVSSAGSVCTDTLVKQVQASEQPVAGFTVQEQCFQNMLYVSTSGPVSQLVAYDWDLGDGTIVSGPIDSLQLHEYQNAGNYTVTLIVENAAGCTDTLSVPVTVQPSVTFSNVEVPNIITPNGDALNDELLIDGLDECSTYVMHIYNRWGSLMFTQEPGTQKFRGTNGKGARLTAGVYFYVIKAGELSRNGSITITY